MSDSLADSAPSRGRATERKCCPTPRVRRYVGASKWHHRGAYARSMLTHELDPRLSYHSLAHTESDVVPATLRFAKMMCISEEETHLLQVAAWYHDIGFVEERDNHELISCRITADVLSDFGFSEAQVKQIQSFILATRLPQTPMTVAEQILADADLNSLGREDFLDTSLALRAEFAAYGTCYNKQDWFLRQQRFLQGHCYFTSAARVLRDRQKKHNIELLKRLLLDP